MSQQDDDQLRKALLDWKPEIELISCQPAWAHATGQGDCLGCRAGRGEVQMFETVQPDEPVGFDGMGAPLYAHQVEDSA